MRKPSRFLLADKIPYIFCGWLISGRAKKFWFMELQDHGYPAAALELADRAVGWFEAKTSDWRQDPGQAVEYGKLLGVVGRWAEAQAVLEDVFKPEAAKTEAVHNNIALRLATVLASQGHRDQAYEVAGLTRWSEDGFRERIERALEPTPFPQEPHAPAR